jgi:hypothetical protein
MKGHKPEGTPDAERCCSRFSVPGEKLRPPIGDPANGSRGGKDQYRARRRRSLSVAKTYQAAKTRQGIAPAFGGPQPIDPAAKLSGSLGAADCPVDFREEIQRSIEADLRLHQHAAGRSSLRSRGPVSEQVKKPRGLIQVFGPDAKLTRKMFALII